MDAMIDIETLGIRPTSKILSIGVTLFDSNKVQTFTELLQTTHYRLVYQRLVYDEILEKRYLSDTDQFFTSDQSTLEFWLQEDEKNGGFRDLRNSSDAIGQPLDNILCDLNSWLIECKKVWSNSPSFDCSILRHAFTVYGLKPIWKFWSERDLRTLLDIKKVNKKEFNPEGFIVHRADHDAAFQAMLVQIALNKEGA